MRKAGWQKHERHLAAIETYDLRDTTIVERPNHDRSQTERHRLEQKVLRCASRFERDVACCAWSVLRRCPPFHGGDDNHPRRVRDDLLPQRGTRESIAVTTCRQPAQ